MFFVIPFVSPCHSYCSTNSLINIWNFLMTESKGLSRPHPVSPFLTFNIVLFLLSRQPFYFPNSLIVTSVTVALAGFCEA